MAQFNCKPTYTAAILSDYSLSAVALILQETFSQGSLSALLGGSFLKLRQVDLSVPAKAEDSHQAIRGECRRDDSRVTEQEFPQVGERYAEKKHSDN